MKNVMLKLLASLMACLMIFSCFVACGEGEDDPAESKPGESQNSGGPANEDATISEVDEALNSLDEIDWGGEEFTILHAEMYQSEIWGENEVVDKENGGDQLINDAVYERNTLLEDKCKLVFNHIAKPGGAMQSSVTNEHPACPPGRSDP